MRPVNDLVTLVTFLIVNTPEDALPPADAIFVLGHSLPIPAIHAAHLWKQKRAPVVLLTGHRGARTKLPDGFDSEARHYEHIMLKEKGVSPEAIILEDCSTNTLENVRFGMERLLETHQVRTLIAVSMPPHLRRVMLTFKRHYPNVTVYGSAPCMPVGWLDSYRIQRVCGEIDRLKSYAEKGDIAEIEIPQEVMSAYRALKNPDPPA